MKSAVAPGKMPAVLEEKNRKEEAIETPKR